MSANPRLSRRTILSASASALLIRSRVFAGPIEAAAPPTIKSFAAPYRGLTGAAIERFDPGLDAVLDGNATIELLAEGFDWSEGPAWIKKGGHLLFTDIPANSIYKWKEGKGITVFMHPSGTDGERPDIEGGANGLFLEPKGSLLLCQTGNRRVARLASLSGQAKVSVLADKFEGKRFNSPNDIVAHPRGDIYFTDPPYGLPKGMDDPSKELKFQGVFRIDPKGALTLISDALERPNGIGLTPDKKTLLVANSHGPNPVILAFPLKADGSAEAPRTFFDWTAASKEHGPGGFDGFAVDLAGNVWATGPGGVVVISAAGKLLGRIRIPGATANCKFGDDGKSLFITADPFLVRVKTRSKGF